MVDGNVKGDEVGGGVIVFVNGVGKAGLKRDGATVEISDPFAEAASEVSVEGEKGFAMAEGVAAFSATANGFGATKAFKEAANGFGDADGVISFAIVSAGLGKKMERALEACHL